MKRQYMADFRVGFGLTWNTLARMCECSCVLLRMLENSDKEVTHPKIALRVAQVYGLTRDQYASILPKCHWALSADYVPGRAVAARKKSAWQSPVARPVLQIKDGRIVRRYGSLMDAERATGIRSGNICNAARGKMKTAGGYEWKYE